METKLYAIVLRDINSENHFKSFRVIHKDLAGGRTVFALISTDFICWAILLDEETQCTSNGLQMV